MIDIKVNQINAEIGANKEEIGKFFDIMVKRNSNYMDLNN